MLKFITFYGGVFAVLGAMGWYFHFSPWATACFEKGGTTLDIGVCRRVTVETIR